MAIGKGKSKMGSLMGVKLDSINQQPEAQLVVSVEEKPIVQPKEEKAPKNLAREVTPSSIGGRPKFELISGMQEKKVNFHCPEELYTAINLEAIKQKKTIKQFICEVLLDEMSSKYGFKLK